MTFLITWYFSFNKIFWLMLNRTHEIRFYKFFLKILYIGFLMIFVMFEIVYSIFAINGLTCKVKSFDFPYNRSTWYFVSINGVGSKLKVGAGGWARLIRNLPNKHKEKCLFLHQQKSAPSPGSDVYVHYWTFSIIYLYIFSHDYHLFKIFNTLLNGIG